MYPKTFITKIIFWLWRRHHCTVDIHLWSNDFICDACGVEGEEVVYEITDDESPEWACPEFADHTDWKECFACMQNYNYHMENDL